jgi:hypothetical protein
MTKLTYQRGSKQGKILDDAKANYKPFKLPDYLQPQIGKSPKEENEDRAMLNFLHEICYQIWTQQKIENSKKIINEESNIIHPCEYRRAS